MKDDKLIILGKRTALMSFIIGTFIFGLYFLTSKAALLFIGYGYIILVGILNLIILFIILSKSSSATTNRKKLLKACGLMLINLPIMLVYVYVAMMLTGTMRITFINSTQNILTNINIIGCETRQVDELKPNERKTVWVSITGDCSINLEYLENGIIKKETVVGYATAGGGHILTHKIDGKNKDIL